MCMAKVTKMIVVSDNHGYREPIDYIRSNYSSSCYFVHCGDSCMYKDELSGFAAVRGNNDYGESFPMRRVVEVAGHRIMVTHSHMEMFGGFLNMLVRKAKQLDCDIVCFGHIHRYVDETIDGVRLLNPGSIWNNRDLSAPSFMEVTFIDDQVIVERKEFRIQDYKNSAK